ncbi:MAG: hypothetical protein Q9217_000855 [Psora testacea]
MSRAQRDENPAIQDFLRWINGVKRTEEDGGRKFVPFTRLKAYFTSRDPTRRLLYALFPDQDEAELPRPDHVERHYLRVFSILLCIHQGPFIMHFLEYPSLQDTRLPFATKPLDFPVSSKSDLFDAFWQKQWEFCVPTWEYNMNYRFEKETVLPIIRKEMIAMGGSSILSKIVVEDEYNHLDPIEDQDKTGKTRNGVFVLKSFRGKNAREYFETERRAFLKLGAGKKLPSNIIGFYGSFVHNDKFNLILEYADRGNLEQFMQSAVPPSNLVDNIDFWENMFGLLRGLTLLHGLNEDNTDHNPRELGWHQDITPGNILVKSKAGCSKYQSEFELADLGLSHFKKNDSTEVMDKDTYGTRAYGMSLKAPLHVRQDVDIWSLGCVFSEALTWSVYGRSKLLEYRRRRQEEFKECVGREAGDAFHDGHKKLGTVSEMHSSIKENRRVNDQLSPGIVELIDHHMMQQTGSRPRAGYLYLISIRLVENARREAQDFWPPSPLPPSAATTLVDESPEPRSTNENFPDNVTRIRRATSLYSSSTEYQHLTSEQSRPNVTTKISAPIDNLSSVHAPNLSLADGLAWKAKSKKGFAKLPYEELLEEHRQRDHVSCYNQKFDTRIWNEPVYMQIFLLDSSASMKAHQEDVRSVVQVLAYILKRINPDGITIYSTSGSTKIVTKKSKDILQFMDSTRTVKKSNMEHSLGNIISDYLHGFDRPKPKVFSRWPFRKSFQQALSIYVFTDGIWQPKNDPYDPIASLYRRLQSENLPRSQVGIQFIRFGHSIEGIERLKELDSSLSTRAQPLDIVDTEPHDGNILKMLLGSINHWFDEDATEGKSVS